MEINLEPTKKLGDSRIAFDAQTHDIVLVAIGAMCHLCGICSFSGSFPLPFVSYN